jgi:tRNA threonylcarbamoyladenosine biosynthesis protein TsaB
MDARRSQVYNALFEYDGREHCRICPDRAISVEELISHAKSCKKQYLLIGDGAVMCYNKFNEAGVSVRIAPDNIRLQSAYGVARAAMKLPAVDAETVEPNYLRLSQAERERLENKK